MTVYITQEMRGRDLSDAAAFGELELLLPAKEQVSLSAVPTINRMQRKLVHFTDNDYLLLSGDPVCIGIACVLAYLHNNGRYKVLKWDRLESKYFPVEVGFHHKPRVE